MDRPFITSAVKFSFKDVLRSVCSPQVIMVSTMVFMTGMLSYGLAIFLPSIVSQLGFSPNASQLLSVGPFVAGFIGECLSKIKPPYSLLILLVSLTSAYLSDRYKSRGIAVVLVSAVAAIGFALFLSKVALSLIQMFCWFQVLISCRTKIHIIWRTVLDGFRGFWNDSNPTCLECQ